MIRKRLASAKRPEIASAQPRRHRLAGPPSTSIPSDECDSELAELEANFMAEQERVRDAIRREIGGDVLSFVQEGLKNMSRRERRRVQSFLDHRLVGQ